MAYLHLAAVYDDLMSDTPYDKWLAWAESYWDKHGKPKTVIDLGCGTGSIAIPLAKQGYQVFGVDLSSEMLSIAHQKALQEQTTVTWVAQDMRELSLQPVESIVSFCDSLSYLTEEDDVRRTFQLVYQHLQPGGSFLFDVHSPSKIIDVFGHHTFTYLEDEVNYIWQCFTDADRLEVEHQLTFFIRQENGLYEKWEENHLQRAYQPISMIQWLKDAGFQEITLTADFVNLPPHEKSERLFYTAKKPAGK